MGNSLRCCLACVLPCGALDLIRVVHLNGCVDEFTGRVTAAQFLQNYPDHVLTNPCSHGGVSRRILILSPESDLKRGSIYFLIPSSSVSSSNGKTKSKKPIKKYRSLKQTAPEEKQSPPSRRRKLTARVWRPQLDSIYEEL